MDRYDGCRFWVERSGALDEGVAPEGLCPTETGSPDGSAARSRLRSVLVRGTSSAAFRQPGSIRKNANGVSVGDILQYVLRKHAVSTHPRIDWRIDPGLRGRVKTARWSLVARAPVFVGCNRNHHRHPGAGGCVRTVRSSLSDGLRAYEMWLKASSVIPAKEAVSKLPDGPSSHGPGVRRVQPKPTNRHPGAGECVKTARWSVT